MKKETFEVFIYNDITQKSVNDLINDLKQANGVNLKVRIHCLGGDVEAGFMMYNELRRYAQKNKANITTIAEGQCASIATVIFLAGDRRIINEFQKPFVHEAWGDVSGNANELMEAAFIMADTTDRIANHYAKHTDMTFEQAYEFMSNNSFLTPEQCIELRFAHEIERVVKPLNKLNQTKSFKTMKKSNALLKLMAKLISINNKLELTAADQQVLVFEGLDEGETPAIGDHATVDGKPAAEAFEDGHAVMPDGTTYVFDGTELIEKIVREDKEAEDADAEYEQVLQEALNTITRLQNKLRAYESKDAKFKGNLKNSFKGKQTSKDIINRLK